MLALLALQTVQNVSFQLFPNFDVSLRARPAHISPGCGGAQRCGPKVYPHVYFLALLKTSTWIFFLTADRHFFDHIPLILLFFYFLFLLNTLTHQFAVGLLISLLISHYFRAAQALQSTYGTKYTVGTGADTL
jgi:hypothetical protein